MTHELERGDADYQFSATYERLHCLARIAKGVDPSATLNLTALVNLATYCHLHFIRVAVEAAEVSEATILRDWQATKARLAGSLRQ